MENDAQLAQEKLNSSPQNLRVLTYNFEILFLFFSLVICFPLSLLAELPYWAYVQKHLSPNHWLSATPFPSPYTNLVPSLLSNTPKIFHALSPDSFDSYLFVFPKKHLSKSDRQQITKYFAGRKDRLIKDKHLYVFYHSSRRSPLAEFIPTPAFAGGRDLRMPRSKARLAPEPADHTLQEKQIKNILSLSRKLLKRPFQGAQFSVPSRFFSAPFDGLTLISSWMKGTLEDCPLKQDRESKEAFSFETELRLNEKGKNIFAISPYPLFYSVLAPALEAGLYLSLKSSFFSEKKIHSFFLDYGVELDKDVLRESLGRLSGALFLRMVRGSLARPVPILYFHYAKDISPLPSFYKFLRMIRLGLSYSSSVLSKGPRPEISISALKMKKTRLGDILSFKLRLETRTILWENVIQALAYRGSLILIVSKDEGGLFPLALLPLRASGKTVHKNSNRKSRRAKILKKQKQTGLFPLLSIHLTETNDSHFVSWLASEICWSRQEGLAPLVKPFSYAKELPATFYAFLEEKGIPLTSLFCPTSALPFSLKKAKLSCPLHKRKETKGSPRFQLFREFSIEKRKRTSETFLKIQGLNKVHWKKELEYWNILEESTLEKTISPTHQLFPILREMVLGLIGKAEAKKKMIRKLKKVKSIPRLFEQ